MNTSSLKVILILSDGINGHANQSRGIAYWLSSETGAQIIEAVVPKLSRSEKLKARFMALSVSKGKTAPEKFVTRFNISGFIDKITETLSEYGTEDNGRELLVISTGSTAAPFNLVVSELSGSRCATVMTPTIIGTEPFDFAVVPEHDFPGYAQNVLTTTGSPNMIIREDLHRAAEELLEEVPPHNSKIWSVLLGGDDANYTVSARWTREKVEAILKRAEEEEADVYITTSRRTSSEAASELKKLKEKYTSLRYLLVANEVSFNPIPAMLDFSDLIFATEDSVNMVSEAVTGGHKVILMRTEHKTGIKYFLQRVTKDFVVRDFLPAKFLWGIPRFDSVFEQFAEHGYIVEFNSWLNADDDASGSDERVVFNEAKRAAEWILKAYK